MTTTASFARGLRRMAAFVLDAVLPPRCLACSAVVATQGTLCALCWHGLSFLAGNLCARCGLPFAEPMPDKSVCGACLQRPPRFDRARAALRYDDGSRPLVIGLKHRDRTDSAAPLGGWMARAGAELLDDADLVVPVPLHWTRLFARRFNQSALLAAAVGRQARVAMIPDLLVRRRRTPSQGHLSRAARRRNVAGAFVVHRRHGAAVAGRRIVLIDDVLTTGATVDGCARALRRAGAARVDVLTLARVVLTA